MSKLKITKFKIFVALLTLMAIAFGIYNLMWLNHVKKFDAFLNSPKLQEIKAMPPDIITVQGVEHEQYRYRYYGGEGSKMHLFDDFDSSDYSGSDNFDRRGYGYLVSVPTYLDFGQNVQVLTPTYTEHIDCGDCEGCEKGEDCENPKLVYQSRCSLDLMIFPGKWEYTLGIIDLTIIDVEDIKISRNSAVDKNGRALGRLSDESEVQHQEWLELYEKFNDEIMELFETINSSEYFGGILR